MSGDEFWHVKNYVFKRSPQTYTVAGLGQRRRRVSQGVKQ